MDMSVIMSEGVVSIVRILDFRAPMGNNLEVRSDPIQARVTRHIIHREYKGGLSASDGTAHHKQNIILPNANLDHARIFENRESIDVGVVLPTKWCVEYITWEAILHRIKLWFGGLPVRNSDSFNLQTWKLHADITMHEICKTFTHDLYKGQRGW